MLALLLAAALPLAPAPAAPFPHILSDASTLTELAPGITYGEYRMRTAEGPLSVHVLAVDPRERTVRLGTALAAETLVSPGETLSSMARRTGALAGINADYFDINQTNMPLNLLIEGGRYVRAPMRRPVFAVRSDGTASIAEYTIAQTAAFSGQTFALAPQNDWPPRGPAAMLITSQYGSLHPAPGVTLFALQPQETPGRFDVLSQVETTQVQPRGYYFALGPDADPSRFPPAGEPLTIATQGDPPLDGIVAAAGGGPLLVRDGAWYADPHGPSSGEFATHMPASAAGLRADGTMLFFEIDGRQPDLSVGLLQPQIAALAIAFGARTAMQFDGGGSSTMVARLPGDEQPQVVNSPSDGTERRIADALLVYSDAPRGPPVRLETRPQTIRAVPGAQTSLLVAAVDAGGHTVDSYKVHVTARSGMPPLALAHDGLRALVPVETGAPDALEIDPRDPNVARGGRLELTLQAFDARGYPMLLPASLPWRTDSGRIDARGIFAAAAADAHVSVTVDGVTARSIVTVGEHLQALPFATQASFASAPAGGAGSLARGPCATCLTLAYDFSGTQRAAYANVSIPLAPATLGIEADVLGDGNGETLRAAVENAIHERFLITLSRITWRGWRHVALRLPAGFAQPGTLRSIYVVAKVGSEAALPLAGSVTIRDVSATLAGSRKTAP